MLTCYDPQKQLLVPALILPSSGWVHVFSPTAGDLALLRDTLAIPDALLRRITDIDELARVDHDGDGARLVVVRVPWHCERDLALPYRTAALSLLIRGELVITVALGTDAIARGMAHTGEATNLAPLPFLLHVLQRTSRAFLDQLAQINRVVGELEDQLKESMANSEVLALLRYQKGLVHFITALASNQIMLERMRSHPSFRFSEDLHELLEDALVEMRQASEMTKVASDILSQMMDAFASIISNNLNIVMRVLTSLTIVLAVPMLLASFYGMNTEIPAQHHPWAFWGVVVSSLTLSSMVAWWFARRRWL